MNSVVIVFVAFGATLTIVSGQSYLSNSRFKVQVPGSTTPSALDVVNNLASGSIAIPSQPSNQLSNRERVSNAAPGTIPNSAFPVVIGQQGSLFSDVRPISNNGIAPTFSGNSIDRPTSTLQDNRQNFGGFVFPSQSGMGGPHGFNGFGHDLAFQGHGFSGFSGNGMGSP